MALQGYYRAAGTRPSALEIPGLSECLAINKYNVDIIAEITTEESVGKC